MSERFYKIGEVSELLGIEQHTLRYLENNLKLKIKRDERGDRQYTEQDLETLRLVLQLKERGLNTTAIKIALENTEEVEENNETGIQPAGKANLQGVTEILTIAEKIVQQNEDLLEQNRRMEERINRLEAKVEKRNVEREKKIDEFLDLWRNEQESKNKSWFSRFRGK